MEKNPYNKDSGSKAEGNSGDSGEVIPFLNMAVHCLREPTNEPVKSKRGRTQEYLFFSGNAAVQL